LDLFISEPIRNRANGAWTVIVARKIFAKNGVFLGLVLGAIELANFEQFFSTILLTDGGSFALLRADGVLLVRHPHIESAIGNSYSAAIAALKEGENGSIRLVGKMDGKDRLLAARPLPHFPLYVTAGIDVAAALTDWRTQTQTLCDRYYFDARDRRHFVPYRAAAN
jgi:hypothetical protein